MTYIGAIVAQQPLENRKGVRRIVNIAGYARETDRQIFKVHVENLSREGCLLCGDLSLEPETRIWLKISGLPPRVARIAWSEQDRAGCAFETRLESGLVTERAAIDRRDAMIRNKELRDKLRGVA